MVLQLVPGGEDEVTADVVGTLVVGWDRVRLRARILLTAYLGDVRLSDKLFLARPFVAALKELGPRIGLEFTKRAKNYVYVPAQFAGELGQMYSDAVVVTDGSPGATPAGKLEEAVVRHRLGEPENEHRLLCSL